MATTAATARLISRPAVLGRRYLVGVLAAGLVATVLTVWVTSRSTVLASPGPTAAARGLFVGVYLLVGVYLWWRQPLWRVGPLLVVSAYLYALSSGNASG